MSLLPQGPALAQGVVQPLAERNVYSYGADYVNLGYLPGDDAALAALGDNLGQAFASDFVYGRPLAGFAIAKDVGGVDSVSLAVDIAGDDAPVRRWVEQVQARRQTRLAAATSAVAMPLVFPYLQSGQVLGLASGLPAAAQYEYLLSYTGQATRGLEAQSLGHLVILALIIIANVRLLFRRR
jgi:hypothetical protein